MCISQYTMHCMHMKRRKWCYTVTFKVSQCLSRMFCLTRNFTQSSNATSYSIIHSIQYVYSTCISQTEHNRFLTFLLSCIWMEKKTVYEVYIMTFKSQSALTKYTLWILGNVLCDTQLIIVQAIIIMCYSHVFCVYGEFTLCILLRFIAL